MPVNKVRQVADELRAQILAGAYGKGRLPAGKDLAREYGVSRDAIQKVMTRLEAEGLLESVGERGAIIRRSRIRMPGITPRFDQTIEKLGYVAAERNIGEPAIVSAPTEVAEAMGVPEGTPVAHRFRKQGIRQDETEIFYRLAENFYPTTLVDEEILALMQKDERADVLLAIRNKYNKVIARTHEDVIGRLPTTPEEDVLGILTYTPVLEIRRVNYAEDDTVIMVNKIIFVANFFVLSYDYSVPHWK
jgi:GntR family transcriptional regulator